MDIPAGDTVVFFEFVETQTTQEGVWKIAGFDYDFDLAAKLDAFEEATSQLALNKALVDLGIENVVVGNVPTYLSEKATFLTELKEDLSVENIQAFIDKVNADIVADGEKSEAEAAAVEAVAKAIDADNSYTTPNDIALAQALQNEVFTKVNAEWVEDYSAQLESDTITDASSAQAVQASIEAVNTTKITAALDGLTSTGTSFAAANEIDSVDADDLKEAKELIEAYAPVDSEGEYVAIATVAVDDILEQIDVQLAVADVLAATTPTTLKAKLTALDNLEAFSTDFIKDNFKEVNLKHYLNGFGDPATGGFNQVTATAYGVTDIESLITDMNNTVSGSYVTAVNNATDADVLLAKLKAFPGLEYVVDANKDFYWTTANANFDSSAVTDFDSAQATVVTQNIAAINAADKTKIIAALNALELDNVIAANAEAYVADDSASVYTDASAQDLGTATDKDDVQAAVEQINKAVVVAAQVKAINDAEDVATVKAALDTLADVNEVADYLKIRSVDRDFVAAYVLEERPDGGYVAGVGTVLDAIDAKVTDAQVAYAAALAAVNALQVDSTVDSIVAALEGTLDEAYNDLSNTSKVTSAEAFYDKLVFTEDGSLKTPFITLAAVKSLLK